MLDDGDDDGREEIFAELAPLGVVPRKAFVLLRDELMDKQALLRPEEVAGVKRVDAALSFFGIAPGRNERRRSRGERGHVGKRVAADVADDAELVGEGSENGLGAFGDRFVFFLCGGVDGDEVERCGAGVGMNREGVVIFCIVSGSGGSEMKGIEIWGVLVKVFVRERGVGERVGTETGRIASGEVKQV